MNWLFFVIALVFLVLMAFMPNVIRLRIMILRWLHWNRLADMKENHFLTLVLIGRIVLIVAAVVCLYFGWAYSISDGGS
jgi:hypothetical protein